MLEKIKTKWLEWFFAVVLIVITTILTNFATVKREANKSIVDELKDKASTVYVDNQNFETRKYIDKQDDNILSRIDQHTKETEKTNQIIIDWLKAINAKVDKVDYQIKTIK